MINQQVVLKCFEHLSQIHADTLVIRVQGFLIDSLKKRQLLILELLMLALNNKEYQ